MGCIVRCVVCFCQNYAHKVPIDKYWSQRYHGCMNTNLHTTTTHRQASKRRKVPTDTLYLILAILSVTYLILATYILIQTPKPTDLPEPNYTTPNTKTIFHPTDDLSEKVQTITLTHAQMPFAPAGQEHYRTSIYIHSGAKLLITRPDGKLGTCTLTVINPSYGITAGHCADIGSIIEAVNNDNQRYPIGTVTHNLLTTKQDGEIAEGAIDVAVVTFSKNVTGYAEEIKPTWPKIGDTVSIYGQRSKGSQGHVISLDEVNASREPSFATDALVRNGDSGGPVYSERGQLLGIVQYSTTEGVSGIAPIKNICESNMPGIRCGYKSL